MAFWFSASAVVLLGMLLGFMEHLLHKVDRGQSLTGTSADLSSL
jgi:hypothetical protein